MSQPNDSQRDELRDRLLEQALREMLGGESPPDLSDRILAAADEQTSKYPQPRGEGVMEKSKKRHRFSIASIVAICGVVVVFGGLVILSAISARNSTRRAAVQDNMMLEHAPPSATSSGYSGPMAGGGNGSYGGYGGYADEGYGGMRGGYGGGGQSAPGYEHESAGHYGGEYVVDKEKINLDSLTPEELVRYRNRAKQNQPTGPAVSWDIPIPGGRPEATEHFNEDDSYAGRPGYVAQQNQSKRFEFSAGVKSEAGVVGSVVVNEKNFDSWRHDGLQMMVEPRVIIRSETEEEVLGHLRDQLKNQDDSGQGPGRGGDQYVRIVENPFQAVKDHPLSTFSIDVDTASYANVRRFLLQEDQLPPPDAVRIEELVNYFDFDYDYSGPTGDVPFASHIEVAGCPWTPEHRLVRIALKGYEIDTNQRPKSNLVFLLDVSGSMSSNDKLPLLQKGMKLLAGQLGKSDRVAIVVYAGSEGLVLPSTPGDQRAKVLNAIDRLKSGGSTNGGAGIELAYKTALENFIKDGVNRVILCTDGDFNVGTTSTGTLERMVEEKAKSGVFLSVLGFGRGNLNDAMMETISNKGNGNYAYIDGITEAQKVLVEQMGGTLVTIAKDVKIQVEFNPTQVEAYRLIGYENRMLAAEDFNDDKKDAGEIGAGHTVTALYELVPAGGKVELPDVDPLRYQTGPARNANEDVAAEMLTLKLRYKEPDGDTSELLEFPSTDSGAAFSKASPDFQFAAAVASFGMLLRGSAYQGMSSYDAVLEIAESAKGADKHGYRAEFVEMVKRAKPHGERRAALLEEARRAHEAARESAERAKSGEGVQGVVLTAADTGLVEVSLGTDDGVLKGHVLDVYRSTDEASYVGSIEVVNTKPDKAVCKALPSPKKGDIQVSDRVVARAVQE